jgi:hypothetical protein
MPGADASPCTVPPSDRGFRPKVRKNSEFLRLATRNFPEFGIIAGHSWQILPNFHAIAPEMT